ncbi:hypothetical protein D6829_00600 [Candidatus Pacearchaeota archaeon]|nr:MAG: hypothetical protein D6829_00600 [Candidatus Pacearchaeota archaeon]
MRRIYAIDFAIVLFSLAFMVFLFGWAQPLVVGPRDGFETTRSVLFSVERADKVLIDDNPDFTSPMVLDVRKAHKVELKPGVYFWKAEGVFGSDVRRLTIKSFVSLEVRPVGNGFEVLNAGNVDLNVLVYDNKTLVKKISLEKGASKTVRGNKFVGGMK